MQKEIALNEQQVSLLKMVEFYQDGADHCARIDVPLERSEYEVLAALLKRMKAKWVQKKSCHVFKTGHTPQIATIDEGYVLVEQDGFFETPSELVLKMLELADLSPGMHVLEPSAGTGAIAKALLSVGCSVSACETNDVRRQVLTDLGVHVVGDDFTKLPIQQKFDRVIMNPPFENDQDAAHVLKATQHLAAGGVLVAITSNRTGFIDNLVYGKVRALAKSVEENPSGIFADTSIATCTIVIHRNGETDQEIQAIKPLPPPEREYIEAEEELEAPEVIIERLIENTQAVQLLMGNMLEALRGDWSALGVCEDEPDPGAMDAPDEPKVWLPPLAELKQLSMFG